MHCKECPKFTKLWYVTWTLFEMQESQSVHYLVYLPGFITVVVVVVVSLSHVEYSEH